MSDLSARTCSELDRDREQLETRIIALTKENESLKAEVGSISCFVSYGYKKNQLIVHLHPHVTVFGNSK